MEKLSAPQINDLLLLKIKYPDWSLRQISKHTRRHGKHLGVSHQTVKRTLDAYPALPNLKVGIYYTLPRDIDLPPYHSLYRGEAVRIVDVDFALAAVLVSSHRYPSRAFDIPPSALM